MSYSIQYKAIYSAYDENGYTFNWPKELSDYGRVCIQNILFEHSKLALELDEARVYDRQLLSNVYFLMFEEGAVLFTLNGEENSLGKNFRIMGMYVDPCYVSTLWMMMGKAIRFVRAYDFAVDSLEGEVYETELDYIMNNSTDEFDYSDIDFGGHEPYSFALALADPYIEGVRYCPGKSVKSMLCNTGDLFSDKKLENVLDKKNCPNSDDEKYEGLFIERFKEHKHKMSLKDIISIRKHSKKPSIWVMRNANDTDGEEKHSDITCLDAEMRVSLVDILKVAASMK